MSLSTLMPAAILSLPLMLYWLAGASGSLGTSINPPPPPQAASHRLLSNITTGRTCDRIVTDKRRKSRAGKKLATIVAARQNHRRALRRFYQKYGWFFETDGHHTG